MEEVVAVVVVVAAAAMAVAARRLHRALPLDLRPFSLELNAYRRLLVGHFLLGLGCGDAKFFEAGGTRGLKLGPSRPYLLPRCFLLAVECPLGRRHVGRHADDRRHLPAAHGALDDDCGLGAVVGLQRGWWGRSEVEVVEVVVARWQWRPVTCTPISCRTARDVACGGGKN